MSPLPPSQLSKAQRQKLVDAQNEEARLQAMARYYVDMEANIWMLLTRPGFPAHRTEDEKLSSISAMLLKLCAKIVTGDGETDLEKNAADYLALLKAEAKLLEDSKAAENHEIMAAIVAGIVIDPAMVGSEPIEKLLDEPWLDVAKTLIAEHEKPWDRAEREKQAFAALVPFPQCPSGATAQVLRQKLTGISEFAAEAQREGFKKAAERLLARGEPKPKGEEMSAADRNGSETNCPVEPEEPSNVVSLVDAAGKALRSDLEETATELETAIVDATGIAEPKTEVAPEAG